MVNGETIFIIFIRAYPRHPRFFIRVIRAIRGCSFLVAAAVEPSSLSLHVASRRFFFRCIPCVPWTCPRNGCTIMRSLLVRQEHFPAPNSSAFISFGCACSRAKALLCIFNLA